MSGKFVYVIYIRASKQAVFDGLTKPEFTKLYWCGTWQESDWKKGADWRIMIPDGRVGDSGKILEIDPPNKLVVSWQNQFVPEMRTEPPSRCTFLLEDSGEAVKLTIIHESDVENSRLIEGVSQGWPHLLASLKSLLETGKPLAETTKWPEGH